MQQFAGQELNRCLNRISQTGRLKQYTFILSVSGGRNPGMPHLVPLFRVSLKAIIKMPARVAVSCGSVTRGARGVHFFLFFFFFFRASSTAYGGSQAMGRIGATAAGLHHSHCKARSEPHLQPTPQLTAMPDS